LKPCNKGTRMNCWGAVHMQAFHQCNILIEEQQVNDINPLYELADMSHGQLRIPQISLILNSATHVHQKGQVQLISIPFILFSKSYCYSLDTMFLHCRPNNICSHTTQLTTPMYFNWLF
jgi:hypothetical protein